MLYYTKTPQETLISLGTTARGLGNVTATKHLAIYGPNVIPVSGDPLWRKLVEPFANVFVGVLIVAAAISLWHQALLDAVIIFAIIIMTAIIYYVQRFSTETRA